jgi:hypothetical protein
MRTQDFLICIEMLIAAVAHHKYYNVADYLRGMCKQSIILHGEYVHPAPPLVLVLGDARLE